MTSPALYVWNVTGNRLLHRVEGVRLKTRPAQCTDFVSIKRQLEMLARMNVTHYRFALDWPSILPTGNRAAHNLLIAHALVWRLYDRRYRPAQRGAVSLSLHADWAEPANPFADSHWQAAERFLQFEIAWFAEPLFKTGDYPPAMREYIASKNRQGLSRSSLPRFTDEERRLVRGAADFYALNHFTTRFVMHARRNGSRYDADRDVQFLQDITCLSSPSRLAVLPWGERKVLRWIRKNYGDVDVYITASGIDDQSLENDELRKYYLERYIQEALKAHLIDKVKIKGYYAFKLTEEKSKPRFGFFTSEFKAKSSVQLYNKLISNSGFPSENRSPRCSETQRNTECMVCLFLVQKKPLIFFSCCFFSTLVLLLSITILHKRKRRKIWKAKNLQHIPLK